MSNQRPSFAKRDREMKLKDKARAKAERRAAKRAEKVAPDPNTPTSPGEDVISDAATPVAPPGSTGSTGLPR